MEGMVGYVKGSIYNDMNNLGLTHLKTIHIGKTGAPAPVRMSRPYWSKFLQHSEPSVPSRSSFGCYLDFPKWFFKRLKIYTMHSQLLLMKIMFSFTDPDSRNSA